MDLNEGEHEGDLMARKDRNYRVEYERDQSSKERIEYRERLRGERVKRKLTGKDGMANGNGDKHIAHKKYKGKGGVTVKSAKANLKDQPKRS